MYSHETGSFLFLLYFLIDPIFVCHSIGFFKKKKKARHITENEQRLRIQRRRQQHYLPSIAFNKSTRRNSNTWNV